MSYKGLRLWQARFVVFYEGLRLWEARFVVLYEGLRLWEARFVVFYEGLRLSGGRMSNHAVREGGSAKERPSRAWGEGEGQGVEARSVMFYEGLKLWKLDLSCFTRV